MPFLDHLEELRWRILWSMLAILVGSGIGFYLVNHYKVLELLIDPIRPYLGTDQRLGYLSPTDPFFIVIKLSITVGLLLAFPVVAAQVWGFISPALHKREKRALVPALYLGLVLFMCGVALAYFVVLPMTFRFMQSFLTSSLRQQIVVGPYIAVVTKVLLAFGAVFEMPVVVMVLSALGIVSSRFLAAQRRFAIAASAILACILTPGDAVTISVFMMGPIILLYELSIGLARLMERRRRKSEENDPLPSIAIIVLLSLAAAFAPLHAQAQQVQDSTKKTPLEVVRLKLQKMGKEAPRDTTPKTDSARAIIVRQRQDSVRLAQQSMAPPEMPRDTLMQLLARLQGYTATQYKGLSARFNADTGKLILTATTEQKASVLQGTQSLTADSLLTYNRVTTVACGYGKPLLVGENSQSPVVSDLVCYNTRDKVGTAIGANTTLTEGASWHVTANLYTAGNDLYGHDARFTDCNLTVPHYHFSAGSMKVVNKDVLVARNVTLNFGDVPVFWLPFFMQSLKQGRRSGILTPRFSINDIVRRNSRYNRRISNLGLYWAASDHVGSELSFDWYANNWTALVGSLDYRFLQQFIDGRVTVSRYWRDNGSRDFTISSGNSWQPNERTALRADLQYATSTDFIRQSSFDPQELNRSIDSNAGLQRRFDWGSVSVQASRRQQLTDSRIDMTLPSLGLNLQPVTIGALTWNGNAQTRFTSTSIDPLESPTQTNRNEITANASSSFTLGQLSFSQGFDLREVQLDAREQSGDSTDGNFVSALPASTTRTANWNSSLNFQQRLIGTTTFTPGISVRGQFARDSITGQMVAAPMRLDFNATLKADLFGFFPGVGSVERIRHRLSPTFTYSYSPEVRTEIGTIQNRVFSADSAREQNRLNIGISQTFEAKLKQSDKQKATADSAAAVQDTLTRDPSQPRRPPQAPKITLLSWSSDAVVYDFVQAREHLGVQTTQVSNSFNSDLLRGFQLRITHDLFRPLPLDTALPKAAQRTREFSPHLSAVSASFSLSGSAGIFRMLGLSGSKKPEAPPGTGSQPAPQAADSVPPAAIAGADLGLLGGGRNRQQTQQPQSSPVGTWNASINYTLTRPRVEGDPTGNGENQMVTGNVTFQPTQNWNVAWNTGYSFTLSQFTDHVLTLTRQMHDWDAHFDFVKAQNGNFSFQFRVSLRANPDIKFDYEQRDRRTPTVIR